MILWIKVCQKSRYTKLVYEYQYFARYSSETFKVRWYFKETWHCKLISEYTDNGILKIGNDLTKL